MSETYTLDERLEYAREKLAAAQTAVDSANTAAQAAHELGGGIRGFGTSGSQRAAHTVRSALNRTYQQSKEADERLEHWTAKVRSYERRIAERDRKRLTRDDVVGATFVRLDHGWRKVVRVNKTTVSLDSGYSWVDRYEFDRILEVRRAAPPVETEGESRG
ncbi:hypothetical protein [Plantibacter sp. YIM 135249]|uniref:hypothetical protein n=1 Tax=Plantibacter sp. YIM 135249 TaxID=3423918 RepID=UPI003D34862A